MSGKDGASRSARWRRRTELCESGDHQLCTPRTKCPVVGTARPAAPPTGPAQTPVVTPAGDVTSDVTPSPESPVTKRVPPAGLGSRGLRLWDAESGKIADEGHLILLEEACRTADTLERLNTLSHADETQWLEFVRNDAESTDEVLEVRVVVNGVLVEQRQQQDVFKRQVGELRLAKAGRVAAPAGQSSPGAAGAGTPGLSAGEASAAPGSPGQGGGGIGDLVDSAGDVIDATGRFASQG